MVTRNIHRNSPTGRIHEIRGIEPLVQDMLPEQPVSSSVVQSRGAVYNTEEQLEYLESQIAGDELF